jgi:PKD repeat protein
VSTIASLLDAGYNSIEKLFSPSGVLSSSSVVILGNEKGYLVSAILYPSITAQYGIERGFSVSGKLTLADSASTTIWVYNNYVYARFTYSPSNPQAGQTVTFNALSSNATLGISSYLWNFGDGPAQTGNSTITHAFQSNGVYPVTLTVTANLGSGQDSFTIPVIVGSTDNGGFQGGYQPQYKSTIAIKPINLTSNPASTVNININFTFSAVNYQFTNQSIFVIEAVDFPQPIAQWVQPTKLPVVFTNQTGNIPLIMKIPEAPNGNYTGQVTIIASDPYGNILTAYTPISIIVHDTRRTLPWIAVVIAVILIILLVASAILIENKYRWGG